MQIIRNVTLVAALLACRAAGAQAQAAPNEDDLLAKAAAQAAALASSLPSFTCDRDGTSEIVSARDGKVKKHADFTGGVRVLRHDLGNGTQSLDETLSYTSVNGKPTTTRKNLPFDVHESFTRAMSYVSAGDSMCYDFTARTTADGTALLDFVATLPYQRQCDNVPGTKGTVSFNTAGDVVRIERTVPEGLAAEANLVPTAAVDFAPVVLDGNTFWLVSKLHAENREGSNIYEVDAQYTHCRLFRTKVTILPDLAPVDNDAPDAPKP